MKVYVIYDNHRIRFSSFLFLVAGNISIGPLNFNLEVLKKCLVLTATAAAICGAGYSFSDRYCHRYVVLATLVRIFIY